MRFGRLKILGGLILAAGAADLTFTTSTQCGSVTAGAAGELGISAFAIRPGRGQLFCYTDDAGKKLRFILARGDDGKIHSAFDACAQCFGYHRGYRIPDGEQVFRGGGERSSIDWTE